MGKSREDVDRMWEKNHENDGKMCKTSVWKVLGEVYVELMGHVLEMGFQELP